MARLLFTGEEGVVCKGVIFIPITHPGTKYGTYVNARNDGLPPRAIRKPIPASRIGHRR